MRGIQSSVLLSKFCMVQILEGLREGLRKLSALQNSEVYAFGSILNIALSALNRDSVKWPHK